MLPRSHQPHQAAPHRAHGQQHKRQHGSQDGKTNPSPSRDTGRRRLRPHMTEDHPRDADDFSWTPSSNCQLKAESSLGETQLLKSPLFLSSAPSHAEGQLRKTGGVEGTPRAAGPDKGQRFPSLLLLPSCGPAGKIQPPSKAS